MMENSPLETDERLEFQLKLRFPVSVNATPLECGFSFCDVGIKGCGLKGRG